MAIMVVLSVGAPRTSEARRVAQSVCRVRGVWRSGAGYLSDPSPPSTRSRAQPMSVIARTVGLLILSNLFMTYAWYGHLRTLGGKPWYVAALVSWGIALFEYLLQVPANRLGFTRLTLPQLKIMQEVITLLVFVPFAVVYMKQAVSWNYLWAGLCMLGAVFFVFRA
jgi:uncharacterized protein (DUF486 family)